MAASIVRIVPEMATSPAVSLFTTIYSFEHKSDLSESEEELLNDMKSSLKEMLIKTLDKDYRSKGNGGIRYYHNGLCEAYCRKSYRLGSSGKDMISILLPEYEEVKTTKKKLNFNHTVDAICQYPRISCNGVDGLKHHVAKKYSRKMGTYYSERETRNKIDKERNEKWSINYNHDTSRVTYFQITSLADIEKRIDSCISADMESNFHKLLSENNYSAVKLITDAKKKVTVGVYDLCSIIQEYSIEDKLIYPEELDLEEIIKTIANWRNSIFYSRDIPFYEANGIINKEDRITVKPLIDLMEKENKKPVIELIDHSKKVRIESYSSNLNIYGYDSPSREIDKRLFGRKYTIPVWTDKEIKECEDEISNLINATVVSTDKGKKLPNKIISSMRKDINKLILEKAKTLPSNTIEIHFIDELKSAEEFINTQSRLSFYSTFITKESFDSIKEVAAKDKMFEQYLKDNHIL